LPDAPKKRKEFIYTGEKLSLNFQDIEVRSVLQLIADFTSLNLVASDTVSGRITLRLQNVPWDQALELILKTKGLDKRTAGNVMLVAPADEIAARERLELEASNQNEQLYLYVLNICKLAMLKQLIYKQ
jgi:type IV pilus assembly protein PilQ